MQAESWREQAIWAAWGTVSRAQATTSYAKGRKQRSRAPEKRRSCGMKKGEATERENEGKGGEGRQPKKCSP
eukprot:9877733-Prorocentrum_lima.AAC.1